MEQLRDVIETAFEQRDTVNTNTKGDVRDAVNETLSLLDSGHLRVAEKVSGGWIINEWAKKAILLSFRLNDMQLISHGPSRKGATEGGESYRSYWYDKVPSKFLGWGETQFKEAGFRAVPGCFVRHSAFIGKNVVLMPSFVNLGAYVDEGTMIDTWATVGSCAQIGKHCHISGGAGIGGVLEPLQANPVIIEDNC
ncbi:MAG: 2,3,4,5-tetrahydropyridine-2,6-dicarboxylate N-succinyltransferase, partial [Rickettsiales bacterium]|nr:2,3,4,5-tetrahydropyridine-2,6-dicarboxylate N-succinyltransferase [Rickettsiales bacterium]